MPPILMEDQTSLAEDQAWASLEGAVSPRDRPVQ
jgi:hypothetical protein